ncbi:MAG: hypothetical protein EXR11_04220 [Rhodospirillaceae bacterium]|nr:hypothetical protein [Rhodospirillaceae bacterium]
MTTHTERESEITTAKPLNDALDLWRTPETPAWLATRARARMADATGDVIGFFRRPLFAISLAASLMLGSAVGWVAPLPPVMSSEEIEFTW